MTVYLVDEGNPTGLPQVVEEVAGGAVKRRYVYGLARISQTRAAGAVTSYYGYDGHGDVRFLKVKKILWKTVEESKNKKSGGSTLNIDFNLNLYFIMVDNFTGDPGYGGFAIPPEYPVYTPIRLDNPSITYTTLDSNGIPVETTVNLDSISPGSADPPDFLFFDSSTVFQSIFFTAYIYPDTFTADSLVYQAADITASASLANPDRSPIQLSKVPILWSTPTQSRPLSKCRSRAWQY